MGQLRAWDGAAAPRSSAAHSTPAQPFGISSDGSAFLLPCPESRGFTSGLHGMQQPDAKMQAALGEPGHPGSPLHTSASVSPHVVGACTLRWGIKLPESALVQ